MYGDSSRENEDLAILVSLIQAVHKSSDLEEIYQVALSSAVRLENVDMASIYLIDEEKREAVLTAHRNLPYFFVERAGRIPYPRGITWKAINSRKILNIEDVQKDPDIGPAGRELGPHSALVIPITLEEKSIGVIWFISYREHRFNEREISLLSTLGNQIAIALARAKMLEEMKKREEDLKQTLTQLSKKNRYEAIISTVTRSVHHSINLPEVLENAVEVMSRNIDVAENVSIYLVEREEAILRAYRGYPDWFVERVRRIPYPKGATWRTIIDGIPRYCPDVDQDTDIGPAGRELGTKSYLSMPIRSEDKTVGCIKIDSFKKNAFDDEELKLLGIVAQQIDVAINNARQAEALRQSEELYRKAKEDLEVKVKDLEILTSLIQAVHKSSNLEEVYSVALNSVTELENVDIAMIYLVDEERRQAVIKAHRNLPEDYIKRAGIIPYPKGLTWKVINTGKILNIEDNQKDPDIGPAGRDLGHHSILGIPIFIEDKVIGVIWFLSYKERRFNEKEVSILTTIGNQIAIAIAKTRMFEEIRQREEELRQSLAQLSRKNRYETIISTVTGSVHRSINLQDVLENAVEAMSRNIDKVDCIAIYLAEDEEAVLRAYRGYADSYIKRASRIPYPIGVTWKTIIGGRPIYCADGEQDTVIGPAGREMGTESYLSMPIRSGDKTVGTLNLASFQKNAFDEEELKLLEIVAQQIEIAINNAKQAEELQKAKEELELRVYDRTKELIDINKELTREIMERKRVEEKLQELYPNGTKSDNSPGSGAISVINIASGGMLKVEKIADFRNALQMVKADLLLATMLFFGSAHPLESMVIFNVLLRN